MPLLGAIGNASEYSFRGTYDNYPFDIDFGDLIDVLPGQIYTTTLKLIDDINYKVPISISGDGEYFVVNITFDKTFDSAKITLDQTGTTFDSTFPELDYSTLPSYVRNGNTVGLRVFGIPPVVLNDLEVIDRSSNSYNIPLNNNIVVESRSGDISFSVSGSIEIYTRTFQGTEVGIEYYGKTYTTTVTVGKREFVWTIKTIDGGLAENFQFQSIPDVNFLTEVISDVYNVQGLTVAYGFEYTADITSNEGSLSVNNGEFVNSSPVKNGDALRLKVTSSNLSSTPKTVTVRISLNKSPSVQKTASWEVTTIDNVPSNLSFTDVSNAELDSEILSEIITIDGLSNFIDFNVEIVSPDSASLLVIPKNNDNKKILISGSDGYSISLNPNQLTTYDGFKSGIEYSIISNSNVGVNLYAVGAGGGGSTGGNGGAAQGTVTLLADKVYKVIVGLGGSKNGVTDLSGGGDSGSTGGNSGGGFTGIFDTSIAQQSAILIAGGGGGAAEDDYRPGGDGGGLEGESTQAGGGTQTSGGSAYVAGENGSSLKGGDADVVFGGGINAGGAGGGGYWGGGSARGDVNFSPGPYGGGGGSGYIHPTLVKNGSFSSVGSSGGGSPGQDGTFKIVFATSAGVSNEFTKSSTIKNGDQLQLKLNTSSIWLEEQIVTVKLEDTSSDWKVTNRTIDANDDPNADKLIYSIPFNTINQIKDMSPEVRLKSSLDAGLRADSKFATYEGSINPTLSTEQSKYYDGIGSLKLAKGTTTKQFEVSGIRIDTDATQSLGYDNFTIELWMRFGGFDFGGENSMSILYPSFFDNKNPADYFFQFYVKGDNWPNVAQFRRGLLLAFPNIETGSPDAFVETSSQVFTTNTWHHIALTRSGNTFTIWVDGTNRGSVTTSRDLTSKSYNFILPNFQRLIPDDVYVQDLRLYKGVAKYTSNFNTVNISSIMESIDKQLGQFYTDASGRILILSCATAGKDPRTLTKVPGIVLPGTDTCIDDERWQNFLNLARTVDGYRLAPTLDNSTTAVINPTTNNIRRMINANILTLRSSLTDFDAINGNLAWDETSGADITGLDYSLLNWTPSYSFGYYGQSNNPFFDGYSYSNTTANWWILPPGVPNFSGAPAAPVATAPTPAPAPSNPCPKDNNGRCGRLYRYKFSGNPTGAAANGTLTPNVSGSFGGYNLFNYGSVPSSFSVDVYISDEVYYALNTSNVFYDGRELIDDCSC